MSHARQQIRERLASLLTGLTTTGSRVYQDKIYPSMDSALPGINITTGPESSIRRGDETRKTELWKLPVELECRSKPATGTDVDDQIDTILGEIKTKIEQDRTLTGLIMMATVTGVSVEYTGKLERLAGKMLISLECKYLIAAGTPGTLIAYPTMT